MDRAQTEVSGTSSSGEAWIADVMCSKEGAKRKAAFEVQLSPQTLEETESRQAKYARSDVRAVWLMRSPILPISRQTPAFLLREGTGEGGPVVCLPSRSYQAMFVNQKSGAEPRYWSQIVPLDEFVVGTLSGRLKFAPSLGAIVPLNIRASPAACWRCKKETLVLLGMELALDAELPGHGNISVGLNDIDSAGESGRYWLDRFVPSARLAAVGIGVLKERHSRTLEASYLSNGCVHCDALQGRHFEHELFYESRVILTLTAEVERWMSDAADNQLSIDRWWFDRQSPIGTHDDSRGSNETSL